MKESKYPVVLYHAVDYSEENPQQLSRIEILDSSPITKSEVTVREGQTGWVSIYTISQLTVLGHRIFWKQTKKSILTFKDGKLFGDISEHMHHLIKALHLDWMLGINVWCLRLLRERKDLWTLVFKGKITNPEVLAKTFSKKYFGGAYSYKTLRRFCENPYISRCQSLLWNLWYYTTNPELALAKFIEAQDAGDPWEFASTRTLEEAMYTGEKINPLWSTRRLYEVQEDITLTLATERAKKYSDEPIAPPVEEDGVSLLLDKRSTAFEGCFMHNCVFSNYWKRILRGKYLIGRTKGKRGRPLDVGIAVNMTAHPKGWKFQLDQLYGRYEASPTEEEMDFCTQWVEAHQEVLLKTFSAIRDFNRMYPEKVSDLEKE
jgi:hypothetical protein